MSHKHSKRLCWVSSGIEKGSVEAYDMNSSEERSTVSAD